MQEIKKRRIVIASVLKPVDDTRMYEKIGQTLATYHDVHVIGFQGVIQNERTSLVLHPVGKFSRLSLERILKPWQILLKVIKLKPDLLIICTHELLMMAVISKALTGCRIWYDVQENYWRNILHTNAFPVMIKPFLAAFVRLVEWTCSPFVERFLLAERAYATEIPFMRTKGITVENKAKRPSSIAGRTQPRGKRIVFTGTLSESTGVFLAIDLVLQLHTADPQVHLMIVGFCPRREDYEQLVALTKRHNFVTLIGGANLVPHEVIVREIEQSDYGIISYPPNPSTSGSIPTKLYEYLAYQLPILLIENNRWVEFARKFEAAIVFDPNHFNPEATLSSMASKEFYPVDPQGVYWEEQEDKILQLI